MNTNDTNGDKRGGAEDDEVARRRAKETKEKREKTGAQKSCEEGHDESCPYKRRESDDFEAAFELA